MTRFRPCIDLHQGLVKQIVGGTLSENALELKTNFISDKSPAWYANLYKKDGLEGAHVIMLGPDNDLAAQEALKAWPGGLQLGGGIHSGNALLWLNAGAAKVIVTSWLFRNNKIDIKKVQEISSLVSPERLVIDLSCRKTQGGWVVATNRWQTRTDTLINPELLNQLATYCSEFLIHAADEEGLQSGMDEALIQFLGQYSPIPTTYAGGASSVTDLHRVAELSNSKVDLTLGSALDIFGGCGARYKDCVEFNQTSKISSN
jgi:phosphoribosylformimino-5-aminoimidazole carboxamide ribotide isomerase